MGFAVAANDLEHYSYVINSCHLGTAEADADLLFREKGGLGRVLAELNSLPPPREENAYISRHYAPRSTEQADWRTERLFYTRENALVIDAVRERIEEMYPGTPVEETSFREKMILLAPLLYEAATHTNTSGVFKACHRGFGGHGRDALKRIMAGIILRPPVLIDAPAPSTVACMDAKEFLSGRDRRHLLPRSSLCGSPVRQQLLHAELHRALGQAAGERGAGSRRQASEQGRHPRGLDQDTLGVLLSLDRIRRHAAYRAGSRLPMARGELQRRGVDRPGGVVRAPGRCGQPVHQLNRLREVSRGKAKPGPHHAQSGAGPCGGPNRDGARPRPARDQAGQRAAARCPHRQAHGPGVRPGACAQRLSYRAGCDRRGALPGEDSPAPHAPPLEVHRGRCSPAVRGID